MVRGKAAGPNGLPVEVFLCILCIVTPVLQSIFNKIYMGGKKVPNSWLEATVTMIQKPNTDPRKIDSYRPISSLNSDYKIVSGIITSWVAKVIDEVIHPKGVSSLGGN